MKELLIFCSFVYYLTAASQVLTIRNIKTGKKVEGVVVTNSEKEKVVISKETGTVNLEKFDENEEIELSHVGFMPKSLKKNKLKKNQKNIFLYPDENLLEELFFSISKEGEKKYRIAEQIQIKSKSDIVKSNPATTADLLSNISGVKTQKSQLGGGSPSIRGFEANRVLLVLDGVRLNNAIYRNGHLQNSITIDKSGLDRVEVVFGPSSVIYGSDALGGVMHFYTANPDFKNKFYVGGDISTRYSSAADSKSTSLEINLNDKKIGYLGVFSYSKFGDLRMGSYRKHGFEEWGKVFFYSKNTEDKYYKNYTINNNPNIQKQIGYSQIDLLQKVIYKTGKYSRLIANIQFSKSSNIPRFDRLNDLNSKGNLRFAEWHYGPQKRLFVSLKQKIEPLFKLLENGEITLAFQNIEESRIQREFHSINRYYRVENVDVFSLNSDFKANINTKYVLKYGIELVHNNVHSKGSVKKIKVNKNDVIGFELEKPILSRYPDLGSQYSVAAAYSKLQYTPNKNDYVSLGIRYSYTFLRAQWSDTFSSLINDRNISIFNSALTYSLGYTKRLNDKWNIVLSTSSGFRSPNIDDIGKVREKNYVVSIPNVKLKPEYAYNFQVGIRKELNSGGLIETYGYFTYVNDYIFRNNVTFAEGSTFNREIDSKKTTYNIQQNLGSAKVYGVSLELDLPLYKTLSIYGDVTYTRGEMEFKNLPLPSIPPVFGKIGISYILSKIDTELFLRFNAEKPKDQYDVYGGIDNIQESPNSMGFPSWETWNFRLEYRTSDNFSMQFAVENILDRHYKEFASGISAPGRDYIMSARYRF